MTAPTMKLSWTRRWSRATNLPRTFVQADGVLLVLRERGWISIPATGIPEMHGLLGPALRHLLPARSGSLWGIDDRGAILRHDGASFREAGDSSAREPSATEPLCRLLLAMQPDGGPSLPHGLLHVDTLDRGALVRCVAGSAQVLWRGSNKTLVGYQGRQRMLGELLDGKTFEPIFVGSLADSRAIVVDRSGAMLSVTQDGRVECLCAGYVFRSFRHTYPDPDPDEIEYPVRAAAIAHDGSVWLVRPGMGVEHATIGGDHVEWLELDGSTQVQALGVSPDGALWGIHTSCIHTLDTPDRSGWLQALTGPRAGFRVLFEPPSVQGAIAPDAWLIEEDHHRAMVRLGLPPGDVVRGLAPQDVVARAPRCPGHPTSVEMGGLRWEADGARLCVRVGQDRITVAETTEPILDLLLDGENLWTITLGSIARWNGAALVHASGPGAPFRDLVIEGGAVLALTDKEAFTARAKPLEPAFSPAKPEDITVLSRLLGRAVCRLWVAAGPADPSGTDADGLASALRMPKLRGTWREVPAPVAGAAVFELWAGDEDSPGLEDDLRAQIAGCFARAAGQDGRWLVRKDRSVVRAVMLQTQKHAVATWREVGP